MQGLYCTHFLKRQYPSNPHSLTPIYPRRVRRPRASAVLLFYTDQMNKVHSSEEAPRSFTMAPCVVVERLESKQRCSRAAVSEHAGIQAREWSRWLFTKKQKVNKKTTKPCNSPHTITTARRPYSIPIICTGAGQIHPVHSQPMSLATEAIPQNEVTFLQFSRVTSLLANFQCPHRVVLMPFCIIYRLHLTVVWFLQTIWLPEWSLQLSFYVSEGRAGRRNTSLRTLWFHFALTWSLLSTCHVQGDSDDIALLCPSSHTWFQDFSVINPSHTSHGETTFTLV